MVGIKLGSNSCFMIGTREFLYSFLSTIAYHLEKGRIGKKYFYITVKMCNDGLVGREVKFAKKELLEIQKELQKLSPDKIIWNLENISKTPPWGYDIADTITDLSNYFITSDGRNLIVLLIEVFNEAIEYKENIEIVEL